MSSFYNYKCTPFTWHEMNGLYIIDNNFYIQLDDKVNLYVFKFKKGLMTDGGSIPKVFQWFAKGWSDDYKYNACFILHDALYGSELVHRDIADDMLRSSLRDYGMDRLHASTICWCVNTFAKNHYGRMKDDLNIAEYIELVSITQLK